MILKFWKNVYLNICKEKCQNLRDVAESLLSLPVHWITKVIRHQCSKIGKEIIQSLEEAHLDARIYWISSATPWYSTTVITLLSCTLEPPQGLHWLIWQFFWFNPNYHDMIIVRVWMFRFLIARNSSDPRNLFLTSSSSSSSSTIFEKVSN